MKDEPDGREGLRPWASRSTTLVSWRRVPLGAPLTERGLDRLIETVLRYYESEDRPVTDIIAPEQDLAGLESRMVNTTIVGVTQSVNF